MIDEAESLYLELSRITESLIYARLHDDNDLLHGCRNELENYAQSVMQTLKCLVDRKDNIVDIGEVWHTLDLNASEPDSNIAYLDIIAIVDNKIVRRVNCLASLYHWLKTHAVVQGQVKWAYFKDLLPKGGEI